MTGASDATLPPRWTSAPIGTLFDSWGGHTPSKGIRRYWAPGVPWVSSKDIKSDRLISTAHQVTAEAVHETGLKVCPKGAVLVVVRSGVLAHSLPVAIADMPVVINQDLKAFFSNQPLMNEWLAVFLRSSARRLLSTTRRDGTTVQSIQHPLLKATMIPVPPLDVRRKLLGLLRDAGEKQSSAASHLAATRLILERFRKAVLVAACTGRLTADWREHAHPAPAGPALQRRRESERARLGTKYREPFVPDAAKLPGIPEGWTWATLPELGELGRGKSKHRPRNDPRLYGGNYPFIQTGDVARSGGRITDHTQTYNEAGVLQSRVWPERTVCITIAANIADSGLLTYPACFPDSVVGLIADEQVALPEYVELFVRTARSNLAALAPATAQANINLAILAEVAVAIPPIEEQREIVRLVGELFKAADMLVTQVDGAARRVDRSRQALLVKALRGEFLAVPEDAEDAEDARA